MRLTLDVRFVAATWCLLVVGQSVAQDDVKPAADEPLDLPAAPTVTSKVISRTYGISHHLTSAIDRLPDSFRSDPGHRGLIDELQRLTQRVDYLNPRREPPNERRQSLQRIAKSIGDLVNSESPQDQVAPLVDVAAQLLAQLYLESETDGDWGTKVLAELAQLETRLGNEFSSQPELAATVGLERLKITSIPKLGSHPNYYWKEGPNATTAFLKKYPRTTAAAQAAILLASAYEAAQNSPAGLPLPAEGQFREPTRRWYPLAVEQAPESLWGKVARGCLNRLDLVGQTLQVSGKSNDGKPLSIEQFRGKPTVVVFFRPSKSSWGQFATPLEFAVATRNRGCQLLGVLCHNPTLPQDEVEKLPKYATPEVFQNNDLFPVIEDAAEVDSSDSVRFGITWFPRLFVLVDETGKVVRTQQAEIKNLDEFLGLPIDPPTTDAAPPATTTQVQPSAITLDPVAPPQPPTPAADPPPQAMKIFRLKHGVAADYSKLLQDIFTGAKLTADPRTNAIIAAGDEQELQKIEALLRALDESKSKPAAPNGPTTPTRPTTELPKSHREVMVFTATWSSPCQQVLPILRSIAEQGPPIQFVDVNREPELAKRHQVTSIPAVIVVEDGREVERLVGVASRQKFEKLILGRTVTPPDARRTPGRRDAALSDDPFVNLQGASASLAMPSGSQPPRPSTLETRTAELAANVRRLTRQHGSRHPEVIAARQQLETTLSAALDLKLRSEQQQIAELEQRLGRLRSQLAQRQTAAKQIVERRLRDLLEEPGTEWDRSKPAVGVPSQATATKPVSELGSDIQQTPVFDQIVVDLYATDGIYQNDKLMAAVVAPLNKIPQVVVNVRMVPGDSGKFVFAIVRNTSRRFLTEETENGGMSPTRRAIEAALKGGGIHDVRWEGAAESVPSNDSLPTEGEAATGAATTPPALTPPPSKPVDSLEASARLTLDLADAQADVRETEAQLAIQVKLQAKGVVAIDEVTSAMQRRDRAVRRRQILLDEYRATMQDLELQLASAKAEYEGAVTMADQTLALFHLARVSMREVTDANVRRTQADLALQRLQNRVELLKKAAPAQEAKPLDGPVLPPATEKPDNTGIDTIPAEPAPVPATPRR